ncbi:nitrilotriacetate monooxygenase component B [Luminiphilus syltensis NOR5-1B]|uniref:Nitrilotriacetate monooxygenase component B n=1 Tax=Luminiphilus syltensis NOR5-1B TaxID=565045 RepID=B8KRP0_9GAMM|nr:flavin reductase family protein [Luminiphilus syltensis]EED34761.1 nitrilotriacetate monooxygenase component B [Luminiphilus syltensis NOR5-1B]
MDTKAFRGALGRFPTGVCLITVDDPQSGPLALTANSFASVSLDPALVLWSVQNDSEHFREYTACENFGVSVLGADQMDLSNYYATKHQHSIIADQFEFDAFGVPLLRDAQATFSCRIDALHPGGDHHIIVGEVIDFSAREGAPLVFFGGAYDGLQSQGEGGSR